MPSSWPKRGRLLAAIAPAGSFPARSGPGIAADRVDPVRRPDALADRRSPAAASRDPAVCGLSGARQPLRI